MPEPAVAWDTLSSECAALSRDDFASFAACCFRTRPLGDELACRGHGRQARGGARRPDPPADDLRATASFEVACGLGLLSRLVPRPRPERPDRLRQLRTRPRRQIVARLPAHRCQRLVPEAVSDDPAVAAATGFGRL